MNPRICKVRHNPPESYGDCVAACIATMIDRDDVPHVFDNRVFTDGEIDAEKMLRAWNELRAWLASHGKFICMIATDDHAAIMVDNNPGIPYLLWHKTEAGGDHVVICKDGVKIHDPAWYRSAIGGPRGDGAYLIGIIGDFI